MNALFLIPLFFAGLAYFCFTRMAQFDQIGGALERARVRMGKAAA